MVSFVSQQLGKLGLTEEQSQEMVMTSKVVAFDANETIWDAGQPIDRWLHVISGTVVVSQGLPARRPRP